MLGSTAAVANYLLALDANGNLDLFGQGVSSTYATTTNLYVHGSATSTNITATGFASTTKLILSDEGSDDTSLNDLYISNGNLFYNAVQLGIGGGGVRGVRGRGEMKVETGQLQSLAKQRVTVVKRGKRKGGGEGGTGVAGGGAHLVGEHVLNYFPHAAIVDNPEFANVEGFYRFAQRL